MSFVNGLFLLFSKTSALFTELCPALAAEGSTFLLCGLKYWSFYQSIKGGGGGQLGSPLIYWYLFSQMEFTKIYGFVSFPRGEFISISFKSLKVVTIVYNNEPK